MFLKLHQQLKLNSNSNKNFADSHQWMFCQLGDRHGELKDAESNDALFIYDKLFWFIPPYTKFALI